MDIAEFLAARLDEDEAVAMAAASDVNRLAGRPNWLTESRIVVDAEDTDWAICDLSPYIDDECAARHIARHDPARVLRDVAADRKLLTALERAGEACPSDSWESDFTQTLEYAVAIRAERFNSHPDYDPSWRP